MRREVIHSMTRCVVISLAGFLVSAGAQQSPGNAPGSKTKILDLVFHVEDMGGKIPSLEVKETPT
jgi:hypothetical protein